MLTGAQVGRLGDTGRCRQPGSVIRPVACRSSVGGTARVQALLARALPSAWENCPSGNRDNARWHRARGCQRRWAGLQWPRTWSGGLGIADATGLMFGQGMRFHHNWIRNLGDDA
jgi:hypothetical protein